MALDQVMTPCALVNSLLSIGPRAKEEAARTKAAHIALLLIDAVEEADGSFRDLIESECVWVENAGATVEGDGWWDTSQIMDGVGGSFQAQEVVGGGMLAKALSYLDRRGLLTRKEGEPHMVRIDGDCPF